MRGGSSGTQASSGHLCGCLEHTATPNLDWLREEWPFWDKHCLVPLVSSRLAADTRQGATNILPPMMSSVAAGAIVAA